MRFLRIGDASKELGISIETLRRWTDKGKIPHKTSPGGHRFIDVDAYLEGKETIFDTPEPDTRKASVVYCRVSSAKQKDDLERQVALAKEKFPKHEVVSDIGSGLNWRRKGLLSLLERVMRREIKEVVVFHRDRLCRFGFELVEFIIKTNKAELLVLDSDDTGKKKAIGKSDEQELADDILAIVSVFACRQMGKRRYRSGKIKHIRRSKEELQSEEGEDISDSESEVSASDLDE